MSVQLRYRLVHARQTVEAAKFTTLLKQEHTLHFLRIPREARYHTGFCAASKETLTFEEVDFSQCNLTSDTLKVVLG